MDYIHELRKLTGPRKLILNCGGVVIEKDGKVLFQRRSDNGKWGLIGGLVEMNETYEDAALREIRRAKLLRRHGQRIQKLIIQLIKNGYVKTSHMTYLIKH